MATSAEGGPGAPATLANRLVDALDLPAILSVGVIAVVGLYVLVVPPIVGLADNGRFEHVTGPVGIAHSNLDEPLKFDHIEVDYQGGLDGAPGADTELVTSERVFAWVAANVDRLVTDARNFDLRTIGLIHLAALILGAWTVVWATRRMRTIARLVLLLVIVIAVTDAGYLAYLNSFYPVTASILFLLVTVGVGAIAANSENPLWLAVVALAGIGLVTSTPEASWLAMPVAGWMAFLLATSRATRSRTLICAIGATAVLAAGLWSLTAMPQIDRDVATYDLVFTDLLENADDPAVVLSGLGTNPDLVRHAGTTYYAPAAPVENAEFREAFFQRVQLSNVALYLLNHPKELVKHLARNSEEAFELRPAFLGNLTVGSPRSKYSALSVWTQVHAIALPGRLMVIALILGTTLLVSIADVRKRSRDPSSAAYGTPGLLGFMAVSAALAWLAPTLMYGETDLVLRLASFNLLVDLCIAGLVATPLARMAAASTRWLEEDSETTDAMLRERRTHSRPRVR